MSKMQIDEAKVWRLIRSHLKTIMVQADNVDLGIADAELFLRFCRINALITDYDIPPRPPRTRCKFNIRRLSEQGTSHHTVLEFEFLERVVTE